MRQHRPAQAIEHYRRALAGGSFLSSGPADAGTAPNHTGRSREAIPVLLPALQGNDKVTPLFLMTLAQAYANSGDRQKRSSI